jgi:hypothetical protein
MFDLAAGDAAYSAGQHAFDDLALLRRIESMLMIESGSELPY